jgi:hypothetical protein
MAGLFRSDMPSWKNSDHFNKRDRGRALKNNLDFFTHYSNAYDNGKFLILRAYYGAEKGWAMEARFWALNCRIAQAEGARLDLTVKKTKAEVVKALDLSLDELAGFLTVLEKEAELIHNENGVVWTEQTKEDLERAVGSRKDAQNRRKARVGVPSPDEKETSGDESTTSPDKNYRAEQSGAERSRVDGIRAEQSGAEENPARPPATLEAIRGKITDSGIGVFLPDEQITEVMGRCVSFGVNPEGFVEYALKRLKRQNPRNPAGLLRAGLLKYWDWIEEFKNQGKGGKGSASIALEEVPEPPPCSCGARIRVDVLAGHGKCTECQKFYEYDRKAKAWGVVEESAETPRESFRIPCSA